MSILVKINNVDITDKIIWDSLNVVQNLTSQVDTCSFKYRKYGNRTLTINFSDIVEVWDGADQIFGGIVMNITQKTETGADGFYYEIKCSDYTALLDKRLVARMFQNKTILEIITEICADYAQGFNADNVMSTFLIEKIVFNQMKPSDCIKRLAEIVGYDWYIDVNKSIHFFAKSQNPAPYNLTDTSGNYIYQSLQRKLDGSNTVNRVKVRGGEYDGITFTDSITVLGNDTKSFSLPYKFSNLTISLNGTPQTVGIDNLDTFATVDVLYSFNDKSFHFENNLSDGDVVEFSGNPRLRVFAISENLPSIALYGAIEKLVRDETIKDNDTARERADGELYAYANLAVDASFQTRTPGLRVGMNITLTSTRRACVDDLIIKTITFAPIDTNTFGYSVQCISGKTYGLIEILAKLLEPKTSDIDELEISEDAFLHSETITITEEHNNISPEQDFQTITIAENHIANGTEPDWVLAEYQPTSQADTKRQGRLDYSMKLY